MHQKHLLRFIKSKLKREPDEIVIFRDGKFLTLQVHPLYTCYYFSESGVSGMLWCIFQDGKLKFEPRSSDFAVLCGFQDGETACEEREKERK